MRTIRQHLHQHSHGTQRTSSARHTAAAHSTCSGVGPPAGPRAGTTTQLTTSRVYEDREHNPRCAVPGAVVYIYGPSHPAGSPLVASTLALSQLPVRSCARTRSPTLQAAIARAPYRTGALKSPNVLIVS